MRILGHNVRIAVLAIVLAVFAVAITGIVLSARAVPKSNSSEQVSGGPELSSATSSYENIEFEIGFQYPSEWKITERPGPGYDAYDKTGPVTDTSVQDAPITVTEATAPLPPSIPSHNAVESEDRDRVNFAIFARGANESEGLIISVFKKPKEQNGLESWMTGPGHFEDDIRSGYLDLVQNQAEINGRPGYVWSHPASAHDGPGGGLVLEGDDWVYFVGFSTKNNNLKAVEALIKSITINGQQGPTVLPLELQKLESYSLQTTSCSTCGETDSTNNPYSCCPSSGNCTWKCEERRAGADNFIFGSTSGRDAYKWMSLARSHTTYAQGGTMPQAGAVLVAIKSFGSMGVGHVATVTGIGSNGSVTVTEQNCGSTCTRSWTYDTSWLRSNLAGYIYPSSSAPSPTAKSINTSGETTIEDFNFSNTYNFSTYGPGCPMSFNNNERMWGTSSSGSGAFMHFIQSRSTLENWGLWVAGIQQSGIYEIRVFVPNSTFAGATSLVYNVGGAWSSAINQSTSRGLWVQLRFPGRADGYWPFNGVGNYNIFLADTYASTTGQWIAFDAIKFIRRG